MGTKERNKHVRKVLDLVAMSKEDNLNTAIIEALDYIPYEYGTGGWNFIYLEVGREIKRRIRR